jgi:hypothetical protein
VLRARDFEHNVLISRSSTLLWSKEEKPVHADMNSGRLGSEYLSAFVMLNLIRQDLPV